MMIHNSIGLYRDVWIAAIASSRTSMATLSVVMCNTSQIKLRSLRVNSGMGNVICIVTFHMYYMLTACFLSCALSVCEYANDFPHVSHV